MPPPEIAADSYGTVEGVAALARTWTDDGVFLDPEPPYTEGTNPTLTSVVRWMDQVSAVLNTALSKYGFNVPLGSERGQMAAASIVEQIVADLVAYSNSKGRFLTERFVNSGISVWKAVRNDLDAWVVEYAPGLEQDGADREASNVDEIGFRDANERGEQTFPIFQRDGFGNRFQDWDRR